jgi:glycosyltransferase involved in cell wall biosynthesis
MRIAYDEQIFSWQQYGGISRYVVELASELSGENCLDVSVFAPFYFNEYLHAAKGRVNVMGRYVEIPVTFRHFIKKINPFVVKFSLRYAQPDIIHETYYFNTKNATQNAKTVITVHDMVHEKFPQFFSAENPTSRLKANAVKRADHVICVSENTRQDLLELVDIDPAKISVVHHGFALGKIFAGEQGEPSIIQMPYLLYVGSREGYKNFFNLCRTYASSPVLRREFKLVCFGGGPFTADEKIHFAKLGLSEFQVQHLTGDDQGLATCYKNAAALVYPSRYEGFGIPPLEAMSFNCPVACSNTSSIPEVVGDAGEYFFPDDLDSMRDAIHRVALSTSRRRDLILLGRSRLNYFSWKKCANETLNIYRSIIEN